MSKVKRSTNQSTRKDNVLLQIKIGDGWFF